MILFSMGHMLSKYNTLDIWYDTFMLMLHDFLDKGIREIPRVSGVPVFKDLLVYSTANVLDEH